MGVTLFFLEKNLTTFLVIACESDDLFPFLAVVSSALPSYHVIYPVVFLNSATKKLILGRVSPVTPGGCYPGGSAPHSPSDAIGSEYHYYNEALTIQINPETISIFNAQFSVTFSKRHRELLPVNTAFIVL